MAKKTYSDKLKDPRWQKKRLLVLERDGWKCKLCGDEKTTLHVHHKKYTGYSPWDAPEVDLITYCEHCHNIVGHFDSIDGCEFVKIIKYDHLTIANRYMFLIRVNGPNNPAISIFEFIDGEYKFHTHLFVEQWSGIAELAKDFLNGQ